MNTRILSLIFIYSLNIFLPTKAISQEGVEEKLFNEAFPELQGNLLDSTKTSLSEEEVIELRNLLNKLDKALTDIDGFTIATSYENYLVFERKKLKEAARSLNFEKLKQLILNEKDKIRLFMGSKTKFGAFPEQCKRNLALLQQYSKRKKWDEAYQYWNVLFHYFPRSNKIVYSRGADVLEYKFKQTKNVKWIDTLIMLYDNRLKIKYFGGHPPYTQAYILDQKAKNLLKHRPDKVEEAYSTLKKSVELQGVESEEIILLYYMQATENMFKKNKIGVNEVFNNYILISTHLEEHIEDINNEIAPKALSGVTHIYLNSEASTCENLIIACQKKFEKYKTDIEELEAIARMLSVKNCTDNELFSKVAIAIDSIKPSTFSKPDSITIYRRKGEYNKAIKYINKVIRLETVDSLNARNYYKLAQYSNELGKKAQAKSYALKAASLKSNFGAPFILIAVMYASSDCSALTSPNVKLENVAYWAAVDQLTKAKTLDPSIGEAAKKLIERYSARFPNPEKAFQLGLTKGQTIKIGCWINETTTVRF